MTRVNLTKAQCAELANYLRGVPNNGMGVGSFDKIEMLVLARLALAAAEELPEVPRTVARGSATWKPEKALERDTIASRVRYARTCAGLTQTDVSAALGVTPQAISNYERGLTGVPVETLCKMAELYNTSVSSLAGDNGNMPQKPEDASVVDSPASEGGAAEARHAGAPDGLPAEGWPEQSGAAGSGLRQGGREGDQRGAAGADAEPRALSGGDLAGGSRCVGQDGAEERSGCRW